MILLLISASLLLGGISFAIGISPLYFRLKSTDTDVLSLIGSSMLLSSALAVIIPEGFEQLGTSHGGPILALGYLAMFLVDKLVHMLNPVSSTQYVAVDNLHDFQLADEDLSEDTSKDVSALTNTIGLCESFNIKLIIGIHSLADGIAIGSALQGSLTVSMSVIFAMMLHKAPAALALGSILAGAVLPKYKHFYYIAAFAIATPIGAICTYALLASQDTSTSYSGQLLLFSGGTVLFVGVSQLPTKRPATETLYYIAGFIVPIIIAFLGSHP